MVLDELDVPDGFLELERVAFTTPRGQAGFTQIGRNWRRRRRRWRWRGRRWQVVEVDDLAEQLGTVIDPSGPTAVKGVLQTPIGNVLHRKERRKKNAIKTII